jgi:Zn-dependent oligopeptidase
LTVSRGGARRAHTARRDPGAARHRLPHFNHLFTSDSYSAGYHSYLWSEVMDSDTREAFVESGNVFDPTVAGKMRKFILAPGNSTDRAEAYRQFRGGDPDVRALLKKHPGACAPWRCRWIRIPSSFSECAALPPRTSPETLAHSAL